MAAFLPHLTAMAGQGSERTEAAPSVLFVPVLAAGGTFLNPGIPRSSLDSLLSALPPATIYFIRSLQFSMRYCHPIEKGGS